jgi:hypothetical protein
MKEFDDDDTSNPKEPSDNEAKDDTESDGEANAGSDADDWPDGDAKPFPDTNPESEGPTDKQMDRQNAENIIAMRTEQEILRQQNNEDGARVIEENIQKIPVSDDIKNDPQGYLNSLDSPETISDNEAKDDTRASERPTVGDGDRPIRSQVERLNVPVERSAAVDQALGLDTSSHKSGLYDRRDIGRLAESAGHETRADLPSNNEIVSDVNRFQRAQMTDLGQRTLENMWNCTACAKAVDSKLAGVEPDAYAGYIADPPGTQFSVKVTDAVMENHLVKEWDQPIEGGSTSDVFAALQDAGPGARGILVCDGHVANVINRDGTVFALDGQTGTWSELKDYPMEALGWIRTDQGRRAGTRRVPQ